MRKQSKGFIIGLVLSSLIFVGTNVFAIGLTKEITAQLSKLIIKVNGKITNCNNIIYDGNVYTQANMLAKALNKSFSYDKMNNIVKISDELSITTNTSKQLKTSNNIKDDVIYNNWKCKVVKIDIKDSLNSNLVQCTAKGKYIIVLAQFTNNSKISQSVGTNFVAVDDLGRIYKMNTDASLAYRQQYEINHWYNYVISPLKTGTVPIAFDIPLDVKNIIICSDDTFKNPIYILNSIK